MLVFPFVNGILYLLIFPNIKEYAFLFKLLVYKLFGLDSGFCWG